jgi:hypothetical protein
VHPVGPARVEPQRRARDRLRADRADGYAATHAALPVDDPAEIGRRGKGVDQLHVVQRELSGVRDGQSEADVLKGRHRRAVSDVGEDDLVRRRRGRRFRPGNCAEGRDAEHADSGERDAAMRSHVEPLTGEARAVAFGAACAPAWDGRGRLPRDSPVYAPPANVAKRDARRNRTI